MTDNIKFYQGDESRVVIEDLNNYDSSVFYDQYSKAFKIIGDYEEEKDDVELTVPNIIAFCGDRGEGKTSCMLSIRQYLKQNNGRDHKYSVLDTIDPSFFDDKHNLLELVLGQLYGSYLTADVHRDNKNELLECFNTVRNCVRTITEVSDNIYDAIEDLDELSSGMLLKNSMGQLIKEYLKYIDRKKLIIVIDDMDYNWNGAYEMTQFISKYLCHKDCILLISVSISQMVDVVRTSFCNQLNNASISDFYAVACKYVEKLIPLQHRIEMPHVYDICERKVEIYDKNGILDPAVLPIKDTVVRFIFRKTRYLFYNYRDGVSQIVPRNLRMLRQLLGILIEMKDYDKYSTDEKIKRENGRNKLAFQSYFFTNWIQNLNQKNQGFVNMLMSSQDLSQKNKMVVAFLKDKLPVNMDKGLESIISSDNYSYNVSIGDVFTILDFIERNPIEDNDQLLVFFLKSYYSMQLYHYYDDITESTEDLHPNEEETGDEIIFRLDSWFKGTNKLQRFVNGAYFQYNPGDLLQVRIQQEQEKKTADLFVNCDTICLQWVKLRQLLENAKIVMQKTDANLTDADRECVKFVEVMVMMMSWGDTQEITRDMDKRRNIPSPHHLEKLDSQMRFLVLDILAPFANAINMKFTYARFNKLLEGLYEYAYSHDWSLLRQMMMAASEEGTARDKQELKLASDAIIRNSEVLTSMKEKIMNNAKTGDDINKVNELIADFYYSITDSGMKTYPLSNEEDGYDIQFNYIRIISDCLREIDAEQFKSIVVDCQVERSKERGTKQILTDTEWTVVE